MADGCKHPDLVFDTHMADGSEHTDLVCENMADGSEHPGLVFDGSAGMGEPGEAAEVDRSAPPETSLAVHAAVPAAGTCNQPSPTHHDPSTQSVGGGGAWPFSVGGSPCQVDSGTGGDLSIPGPSSSLNTSPPCPRAPGFFHPRVSSHLLSFLPSAATSLGSVVLGVTG